MRKKRTTQYTTNGIQLGTGARAGNNATAPSPATSARSAASPRCSTQARGDNCKLTGRSKMSRPGHVHFCEKEGLCFKCHVCVWGSQVPQAGAESQI